MIANFVTRNGTRHRGENRRGRPRKHTDNAARQKAYRQRQGAAAPFEPGTRVRHEKHGAGIIINLLSNGRTYVAFPGRIWRDLPVSELAATGVAKKIPTWADPEIRNTKKRSVQSAKFPGDKSLVFACFPGVNIKDIPVYTRKVNSRSRKFKDFTDVVNYRIASLVWAAKGKTI